MSLKYISVSDHHGGEVVEIRLGPPPGNIVGMGLMEELSAEIERLQTDDPKNRHRKLIVVTGEGKHFSFGASVEEHQPDTVADMLPRFHALIGQVLRCPIPTLAKVSGQCLGGGFELALACSMIFASDDASLGVPEIRLGVFPPAASVLLPSKTGDSICSEMVLTGAGFSAESLHRAGIVNRVAARDDLDGVVSAFIEEHILPKSASSLRIACEAARAPIRRSFQDNIDAAETLYLETLMSTADAVEGIAAFLQKRAPRWVNE